MKILFLESFFGGSHRDFALGLKEHSNHEIEILSLPDRNWKWRMRGASIFFAKQIKNIDKYDLIFATDMMNLSDFNSLLSIQPLPVIFYFHENQLTYPLSPDQKRDQQKKQKNDLQFGYTNITSALAAKRVLFNSKFQFDEFTGKLEQIIKNTPDFKPEWIKNEIFGKSKVLYPGCRFSKTGIESEINFDVPDKLKNEPPLIIWNHRWEWDKNPDDFFLALHRLKGKQIPFRLALLGEKYGKTPPIFEKARQEFSDELIAFGYIDSKEEYIALLKKGSIVVSTSIQENFGISVIEAARMGCIPLLPNRLSYPEIMPEEYHNEVLYSDINELVTKLEKRLLNFHEYSNLREQLSSAMKKYSWKALIKSYDMEFESMAGDSL
jgi:glycosyltransferase involved in cell wall biosynthesis